MYFSQTILSTLQMPATLAIKCTKRIEIVGTNGLCNNYLLDKHHAKKCRSVGKYKRCHKPHHSVLHISRDIGPHVEKTAETPVFPLFSNAAEFRQKKNDLLNQSSCAGTFEFRNISGLGKQLMANRLTLLCTAMIKILYSVGNLVNCHALLGSGNKTSFRTENWMRKWCLPKQRTRAQFICLGSYSADTNGEVLKFSPHFISEIKFAIKAFVIKTITSNVPYSSIASNIVNSFTDLDLADPLFF